MCKEREKQGNCPQVSERRNKVIFFFFLSSAKWFFFSFSFPWVSWLSESQIALNSHCTGINGCDLYTCRSQDFEKTAWSCLGLCWGAISKFVLLSWAFHKPFCDFHHVFLLCELWIFLLLLLWSLPPCQGIIVPQISNFSEFQVDLLCSYPFWPFWALSSFSLTIKMNIL